MLGIRAGFMKLALLLFTSVLLHTTLCGQYTYFNSHLGPLGGVEAGNGITSQLMISNDSLVNVVVYPNFGNYTLTFNILNMEGEFIHHVHNPTGSGYVSLIYADDFTSYQNGYLYAGVHTFGVVPYIAYFNSDFEQEWEKQVPIFFDDNEEPVYFTNEQSGRFHFAKPLNDGGFMVAGQKGYNFDPGAHYHNVWLQRYNANHELVWDKEFPFYSENIIPQSKRFVRVNDLFELPNGDLLVWGAWSPAWMPMVLRFDSEGNFISSVSWGATGPTDTLNDGLPWPVQIDEEEFLFVYKHGTILENVIVQYGKPRIGRLNAATMQVTLFSPIDREAKHHWINDFVTASDGGYVGLGYGVRTNPENPNMNIEFTYLLKVNAIGEEIWYHEYLPPVEHINPKVYDLELTPDGGYAFVGSFRLVENGNLTEEYRQWVVKTDACGEMEHSGCEAVITYMPQIPEPGQLRVWPNPTLGILNVGHTADNAAEIEVFDLHGRIVHSSAIHSNQYQHSIDVGHLATGLYGLRLKSASGVAIGQTKVLKQ